MRTTWRASSLQPDVVQQGVVDGGGGHSPSDRLLDQSREAARAHHGDGLGGPVADLLGQRPAGCLALAGLQGRLLRELQLGRPVGVAAVLGAVVGSSSSAYRSSIATRRLEKCSISAGGTPTISRTGRLPGSVPGRSAKRHAEPATQGVLEAGVVPLRRGDPERVQQSGVERAPLAVDAAHLVGHRDVGVQVGVAAAGLAVVERGRDQAGGVDLGDARMAGAGERGMPFDPGQRVADRLVMGVLDRPANVRSRRAPTAPTPTSPA